MEEKYIFKDSSNEKSFSTGDNISNIKKIIENENNTNILIVDQILENHGYKLKMISLIIACFFGNYLNSFSIYQVSTHILMIKQLFSSYNNIESILTIISFSSKILGCISLSFFTRYFLRSQLVVYSVVLISLSTLLLASHYDLSTFIIFSVISSFFSGFLEPLTIDNLCETLPIKFRGYILFLIQSGAVIFQMVGFLIVFITKNDISNESENSEILTEIEKEKIITQSNLGINSKLEVSFWEIFSKYFFLTTVLMTIINMASSMLDEGVTGSFANYIETLYPNQSQRQMNYESFKISIYNLIGYLIIGLLLELNIIGRRANMYINLFLSAIFYTALTYNKINYNVWLPLVNVTLTVLNAINILFVSEIYPSKIRDASQGYFVSQNNIGGLIGQSLYMYIIKKNINFPFYVSLGLITLITILLFFVKHDTNNKALDIYNDIEDNEESEESEESNESGKLFKDKISEFNKKEKKF